jgi:dTDP-4-amino-4,6-dideoxygalactose transaminase
VPPGAIPPARPYFADVRASTLMLNSNTVKKAITSRTRAVIIVGIGVLICLDSARITATCRERGFALTEDTHHARGSKIDEDLTGLLESVGCFSFYTTKVITSV